jgi:hypothetical protein
LAGTATQTGAFTFTARVTDRLNQNAERVLTLQITQLGDLNADGCVDQIDLAALMARVQARSTDLAYDLNGDGNVSIADTRFLVLHFSNPGGAPCPPAE